MQGSSRLFAYTTEVTNLVSRTSAIEHLANVSLQKKEYEFRLKVKRKIIESVLGEGGGGGGMMIYLVFFPLAMIKNKVFIIIIVSGGSKITK